MSESKGYVIVHFHDNYADEFDVLGFDVMSREEYTAHMDFLEKYFDDCYRIDVYFGTNENLEYDSLKAVKSAITVKLIDKETYKTIVDNLGSSYGTLSFSDLLNHAQDRWGEDEDEDEDDYE